jgi:hypothetical protein
VVIPGVPASDADVIRVLVRRTKTCIERISFVRAGGNKRRAPRSGPQKPLPASKPGE